METFSICKNIRSKKRTDERCTNPATHDDYCGVHHKHPVPWIPSSPETIAKRVKTHRRKASKKQSAKTAVAAAQTIQKWTRQMLGIQKFMLHGPAYHMRALSTNETDFFSTDLVVDISGTYFFSFRDIDTHVYSFDIRSINTIIQKAKIASELPQNPYNRNTIPKYIIRKILRLVKSLQNRRLETEWEPLVPPTPQQQVQMKVVDLFSKLNDLNYYTSPNWFIELTFEGQRKLYSEMYEIWTNRAGLNSVQKNAIVPNFSSRLFRCTPWLVMDSTLESYQKLNMNVIKLLISSAEDRNDRIVGAMYVVSALTVVSRGARAAYPWLYESMGNRFTNEFEYNHAPPRTGGGIGGLFGFAHFFNIFYNDGPAAPPPLALPPPQNEMH